MSDAEDRARAFLDRVNRCYERHATSPNKRDCPICPGIRWAFVAEEVNLGPVTVYPRYCLACGYTMFVNARLLW